MEQISLYQNGSLTAAEADVVREFPVELRVNGRELATLVTSPHELRYLVAGFLRLQGLVQEMADFDLLSVCEDFGIANVQIRGELPVRLKPTLTSGCGTGITFNIAGDAATAKLRVPPSAFSAESVFGLMDELARQAENYKSHGGIHSAAVGDQAGMILYAEDIGRHNTLDRIAGEALFKGIELRGTALATSGRVSTEMVAKSVQLGISLIASRTSPTDLAIKMCQQAGITLIGYLRGGKFIVYSHPECFRLPVNARQQEPLRQAV